MSTPTVKLYSAVHFRAVGSSIQHDPAVLSADLSVSHGDLIPDFMIGQLDNLKEGESSVIRLDDGKNGSIIVTDGLRIVRLPDYRINRVVFDEHAKECVVVTNGKCVLDHSTPTAFKASHQANSLIGQRWQPATVGCHWTCAEYSISTRVCVGSPELNGYVLVKHFTELGTYPTLHDAQQAANEHAIQHGAIADCQYAPSEAIALRVLMAGGKVSVGWTYRGVDPCDLRPLKADDEQLVKASFEAIMGKRRSAKFVGRI